MGFQFASKSKQPAQRKSAPPSSKTVRSPAPAHPMLQLQRTIGNQGVLRLLESPSIQPKCACGGTCPRCRQSNLKMSQPGDTYEQEADRVADQVMRSSQSPVQRWQEGVGSGSEHAATAETSVASPTRGNGQPLSTSARSYFEPRFGHDFSQVRVHSDAQAAEAAQHLRARAFTVGSHVAFGAGQYAPSSTDGRRLLAHELTHVVQQAGNAQLGPVIQRAPRADTHAGLFELTRHNPLGGPTFAPQAQYDVRLEFLPYRIVDCDEIGLTQSVVSRRGGALDPASTARRNRSLSAAEGTEGVGIDRLSGRTSPLYGVENTGLTGGKAQFGSRTGTGTPVRAWLEDAPGWSGSLTSSRVAGVTDSSHFETCAICNGGTDDGAYYGCVNWGYDIDASNNFTEDSFTRVSKGTPSADFLAAAGKWNAQTSPAVTDDLPIPTHATYNPHMTLVELKAKIKSLETTLAGLAPGDADLAQVTFELRVLRDFLNAIVYNNKRGYLEPLIKKVQAKVGAGQDGTWGYDTVRLIKIWQARKGLVADGRIGPTTLSSMGLP